MTTNITKDRLTDGKPLVLLGPEATDLDRHLALALEELLASPKADSDSDDSNRPILIEAVAWVALAVVVWLAVALTV